MAQNNLIFAALNCIEEIPKCVQFILNETGFNTKWALEAIKSEHILQIEEYFNENYDRLSSGLLGSIYENMVPFKVAPGHRVLIESLPKYVKTLKPGDLNVSKVDCSNTYSTVLKLLIDAAKYNGERDKKGHRFHEYLQYYATYIYLMSGRALYDTIAANMMIPQSNTILNYIQKSKCKIIEGNLRCKELLKYMKDMKLKLKVWICEDATGINPKIQFDSLSNQLVGLVLPLNQNGIPIPNTFLAETPEDIKKYLTKPMSSLVYVVLAQPLMPDVPPFILQIYGIDNKFLTGNVMNRWEYTVRELKKNGIEVIGFSADGDARLLSAMQHYSVLNEAATDVSKLKSKTFYCMQDTVHIGTKLRNRLLALTNLLVFGKSLISLTHLKILINNVPKEVHSLVMKDICPDDRQNFGSLQKMMETRVIEALEKYVLGSEGTQMYLKLCAEITSSLIQDDLEPLERIYRLWHATFVLRAWNLWLTENKLDAENFITSNTYKCIEINALNLILLTKKFRDEKIEELYMPSLFNSQPCEEIFRQFRSMGTVNFTKINFTLLELFHMVGRVELQNDIVYVKLAETDICFPRNKINKAKLNQHKLPCDTEISNTIKRAKTVAINDVQKFGIKIELSSSIEYSKLKDLSTEECQNDSDTESNERDTQHIPEHTLECNKPNLFIEITLDNGTKKTVRKSTYLWSLLDATPRLSNDRLSRVQSSKKTAVEKQLKLTSRRLVFKKEITPTQTEAILTLCKNAEIQIGDWSIFEADKDGEKIFVMGNVLSFRYIKGRTIKEKKYSWDFAPIEPPTNVTSPRGIEVSASWFQIGEQTNLTPFGDLNSFFINISRYVITMECENIKFKNGNLTFTDDTATLKTVKDQLSKIQQQ